MYEAEHAKIKNTVSKASSFALTTDLWTSRANHTYTGVTIYFVNDNFELKHYLLETKEFPESHSVANIAEELKSILSEWGLVETSISAITTDNGRNISAAARELGWVTFLAFLTHYN